jgi:ribosomal protein S18 acetylase RimI-like enzyme
MSMVIERPGSAPAPLVPDGAACLPPANAIMRLKPDEWGVLRDLRLAALKDAPGEFLARFDVEVAYGEDHYRVELSRHEWFACRTAGGTGVAILRIDEVPDAEGPGVGRRHLGYMWVSPEYRRCGVGRKMVIAALRRLADDDARHVYAYLYVFTGNDRARRLYDGLGFEPVDEPELVPDGSGRREQLMRFRLADVAVSWPAAGA